jgi:protocatechuate 3,4-dioxygenase beta subunit
VCAGRSLYPGLSLPVIESLTATEAINMNPHQNADQEHDNFGGLHRDVPALVGRRDMLRLMGGFSLAGLLAACGFGGGTETTTGSTTATTTTTAPGTGTTAPATSNQSTTEPTATPGAEIPDETAGPFPADGSNGPNVLDDEGIVRADLTTSIGGSSGVAEGVPLVINLSVVDAATGSALPGAVVYLWHCTADGRYSIYEIENENYLRGVQVADDAGRVGFTSVFPGCYPGRWPHAHFEVYSSIEEATAGATVIKISQLALPQVDCEAVYADGRYGNSSENLARLSLDSDGVFRDGWADQLATMSGSPSEGYTASLLVRV